MYSYRHSNELKSLYHTNLLKKRKTRAPFMIREILGIQNVSKYNGDTIQWLSSCYTDPGCLDLNTILIIYTYYLCDPGQGTYCAVSSVIS